jgi:hypothetical protein
MQKAASLSQSDREDLLKGYDNSFFSDNGQRTTVNRPRNLLKLGSLGGRRDRIEPREPGSAWELSPRCRLRKSSWILARIERRMEA